MATRHVDDTDPTQFADYVGVIVRFGDQETKVDLSEGNYARFEQLLDPLFKVSELAETARPGEIETFTEEEAVAALRIDKAIANGDVARKMIGPGASGSIVPSRAKAYYNKQRPGISYLAKERGWSFWTGTGKPNTDAMAAYDREIEAGTFVP